jgi:cell division protease FtsH
MTGADLALLVNEAALLAARRQLSRVGQSEFADATEQIVLGAERQIIMSASTRHRTAYHEAGHALIGMLQPGADPVRKISIIPRGQALGVTLSTPENDRYGYERRELIARIMVALGGRAAEMTVYDDTSTGAESDLQQAADIARAMVGRWGMSEALGPLTVRSDPALAGGSLSPRTQDRIDDAVQGILEEAHRDTATLLSANRRRLDALADALLEHETLDQDTAYDIAEVPRVDAIRVAVAA